MSRIRSALASKKVTKAVNMWKSGATQIVQNLKPTIDAMSDPVQPKSEPEPPAAPKNTTMLVIAALAAAVGGYLYFKKK